MRAGSSTTRAATLLQVPNDFKSHSQLWFLSAVIAVHYAIGTMLTNARFERPARGTLARVATSSFA